MTEITAYTDKSGKIDWLAFAIALLLAPCLVSALGVALFPVLFPIDAGLAAGAVVLIFAPFLGMKSYVLFGTPAFIACLKLVGPHPLGVIIAAFLANLLSIPMIYIEADMAGIDAMLRVENVAGLGCVVAPIWGFTFGAIYRSLECPIK